MDKNLKLEFTPQFDFKTECKTVEIEVCDLTDEIDAHLAEIDEKIAELDVSIDNLTNHADKLDYGIAMASGLLTGLLDALFVEEPDFNMSKIQKEFEDANHVANDSAYKHHIQKQNGRDGWISSTQYHRLDDLAHHPTPMGLFASILVRYFRIAIFSNHESKETTVFLLDKKASEETHEKEMEEFYQAWASAALTGFMMWVANSAQSKEKISEDLPKQIQALITLVAASPTLIDIFRTADNWRGHILSDVSTEKGVPGVFLSFLKEISMLPGINKTDLPKVVDELYKSKKMNMWAYAGVAFSVVKKQFWPILINEALVRGFYFVRYLVHEYNECGGFEKVNWHNVVPFGNRTIERMLTISTGVFTAVDVLDAVIEGVTFGKNIVLRLNFAGIGRFALALGTDTVNGLRKGQKSRERMLLRAKSLYLMEVKLYYDEKLMWSAVQDADQSVDDLYKAMSNLSVQMENDMKSVRDGMDKIKNIDMTAAEERNNGLTSTLLDIL